MSSNSTEMFEDESFSSSDGEEAENWGDWIAGDDDEDGGDNRGAFAASGTCITCLFCNDEFGVSDAWSLFDHCARVHSFDFGSIRQALGLDFYGSFKLLNYIRSRVAENICWSCGEKFVSNIDMLSHLHEAFGSEEVRQCLDGDTYLKPFLQKDPLLYSFDQDEEDDDEGDGDDYSKFVVKEEITQDCLNQIEISFHDGNSVEEPSASGCIVSPGKNRVNFASNCIVGATCSGTNGCSSVGKPFPNNLLANSALASRNEDKQGKIGVKMLVAANSIRSVNENYFGAYSSFGIHREMLSDKNFDLVTMKSDEVDFTATVEIGLKKTILSDSINTGTTWCYGLVLWFETGFTERFCKAFATVLSTSPFTPKTHWAQTILTFSEPIAMSVEMDCSDKEVAVGTSACPAVKIELRVSIARTPEHRSIDITVEPTAICSTGRKRNFPLQIFNMQ